MAYRVREAHDCFEIEVGSVPDSRLGRERNLALVIFAGGVLALMVGPAPVVTAAGLCTALVLVVAAFLEGLGGGTLTARIDLLGLTLIDRSGTIRVRWQEIGGVERTSFGITVQTSKGKLLLGNEWPVSALDELWGVLDPAWRGLAQVATGESRPPEALLRLLSPDRKG